MLHLPLSLVLLLASLPFSLQIPYGECNAPAPTSAATLPYCTQPWYGDADSYYSGLPYSWGPVHCSSVLSMYRNTTVTQFVATTTVTAFFEDDVATAPQATITTSTATVEVVDAASAATTITTVIHFTQTDVITVITATPNATTLFAPTKHATSLFDPIQNVTLDSAVATTEAQETGMVRRVVREPDPAVRLASMLDIERSDVYEFCCCKESNTTSTRTIIVTQGVAVGTVVTVTSYTTTVTPAPTYVVATETEDLVEIDTAVATATTTAYLTQPPDVERNGLTWHLYTNDLNYNLPDPDFNASDFKGTNYTDSGILQDVNGFQTEYYPDGGTGCQFSDQDCGSVTVVMQGYFYGADTGNYTFSTGPSTDNALWFWSGADAYTDYTNDNADFNATRAGGGPYYGGSVTIPLDAYDLLPVTIMWVNGGGIGAAFMQITTPDGTVYYDTTGFFVSADDDFSP